MAEFTYKIHDTIGCFGARGAWQYELNKISWGTNAPTFDIRKWTDDHEKMSKGVSLKESELRELYDLLHEYFEGDEEEG